jgi:lipopolysaccharide/colanic/teichoic acid biosynthesis glycosyltransferase
MAIFPIIIDSRPDYAGPDSQVSLVQLPYGWGSILEHLASQLWNATHHKPVVLCDFEADGPAYQTTLKALGQVDCRALPDFLATVSTYEPSDWLLLVNPRCFPLDGFDPFALLTDLDATPRIARHQIALETGSGGTNERVEFDVAGRVRRVQRYFDAVTWTVTKGVAASCVPVSSLSMPQALPFTALEELRRALSSRGVPSLDSPIAGAVVDLGSERGLLTLNERLLTNEEAIGVARARRARGVVIHPSARIQGSVALQTGAEIGEGARVIGPAIVGAGARLEPGALVAQCVVAPNAVVPRGSITRHRVIVGSVRAAEAVDPEPIAIEESTAIRQETSTPRVYPAVKRAAETFVAAVAVAMLSPLLALVAVLVKLDSAGPIFYRDPREAKGGRLFHCFKFRTMVVNAHAAQRDLAASNLVDGPQFKITRDPRITRVGRWLRLSNVDELPQLFNVILGQMSLVGPRPSPFRENQTCIPWREARLSVRPGITGLWQVCRHDRESGDFHQWIYYDIQYVRHMSLMVDLRIIAATLLIMAGLRSHVPLSWIVPSAGQKTLAKAETL